MVGNLTPSFLLLSSEPLVRLRLLEVEDRAAVTFCLRCLYTSTHSCMGDVLPIGTPVAQKYFRLSLALGSESLSYTPRLHVAISTVMQQLSLIELLLYAGSGLSDFHILILT